MASDKTSDKLTVPVTKIQRFSTHDGPGLRTTVFFKGCPLRCKWCHNPETQSAKNQIFYTARFCIGCGACVSVCPGGAHKMTESGHIFEASKCEGCLQCAAVCPAKACEPCAQSMAIDDILSAVDRDRAFFGKEGGLTLSGGEPMAHPEAALALLEGAKARGLNTALETCGFFPADRLERLSGCVDLFLWDFKDSDSKRHEQNTGVPNGPILDNLRRLDSLGARIRLRCVMIRTINMNDAHYAAIADLALSLKGCEGADLLPYHPFGGSKAVQLGLADNGRTDWIPEADELARAKAFLTARGVAVGE